MRVSVHHAALTIAGAFTESLDMTTAVAGGVIGAWAGYTHSPATWSHDRRLTAAGATALIGAVTVNGLADLVIAPMRQRLAKTHRVMPHSTGLDALPAPTTLDEGLAQVAAAAAEDAAHRAALAAYEIDRGEGFLRDERRWHGYENGEASFHLAPGVVLHYHSIQDRYGRGHHFTLLTGDTDEPVTVTSLEQIRHHLATRAAGLPLAQPAAADSARDTTETDGLTGPHTA
ncbi:hypothetical protein [Streptomyces sp. NPDC052701]|uniref:hypothetical protein n=1 Tax=Streptomyces sp. NPDC052701 TaxID=3155533 RepID=UPI0034283D79